MNVPYTKSCMKWKKQTVELSWFHSLFVWLEDLWPTVVAAPVKIT